MINKLILSSIIAFTAMNANASPEINAHNECSDIQSYFSKKESELPYQFTNHGLITDASAQFQGEICLVVVDIKYSETALLEHFLKNADGITVDQILSYVNSTHVNNIMRENFKSQARFDYENNKHPESLVFQYNISYDGSQIGNKLISFNIDS